MPENIMGKMPNCPDCGQEMEIERQDNIDFYYCYKCNYNIPVDEWEEPVQDAEIQANTEPVNQEVDPEPTETMQEPTKEEGIHPHDKLLDPPDPEIVYSNNLKNALTTLLKINEKTVILEEADKYRGEGFLSTEKWTNDDFNRIFKFIKIYKNNIAEDLWDDLLKSQITYVNKKRKEGIAGAWKEIKWEDGNPMEFAGWDTDGRPYTVKKVFRLDGFHLIKSAITLKNFNDEPIKNKLKRLKIVDNQTYTDMIEFEDEILQKSDFVMQMVYPSNVNLFTACIEALPIEDGEYREPNLYIENGIIKFPEKCYARRDVDYQKVLISGLNIGQMDFNVYKEGIDLLTPKQLTLYYGIIGANIINVIGFEDYLVTIDAIGESDTGKSFTIDMALAMDYGIFRAKMNDDALKSSFRHHAIANATNLPIYIEEALLDERSMSRLKSTGKNIRGNMDKSLTNYDVLATFIFSRNTESKDIKDIDAMEKKAQDKRIYKFVFDKNDVIDKVTQDKGKEFINRIKSMAGGMLYDKLKKKNINDIVKKYRELKRKEDDGRKVVSLLGAWIEDNPDFIPVVSKIEVPEIIDEFFAKMLSLHYNKEDAMHSSDGYKNLSYEDKEMQSEFKIEEDNKDNKKWIFQITVAGFNFIKKGLGINQSARNFADGNGFVYKTTYIEGNRNMGIEGSLPDKYAEMLNEKETEKETKTKTKTEKTENNVNIWTGNVPSPEDLGL